MQFFQECFSHIDKNSGKKFEDMFLVKIASQGTSLSTCIQLRILKRPPPPKSQRHLFGHGTICWNRKHTFLPAS